MEIPALKEYKSALVYRVLQCKTQPQAVPRILVERRLLEISRDNLVLDRWEAATIKWKNAKNH